MIGRRIAGWTVLGLALILVGLLALRVGHLGSLLAGLCFAPFCAGFVWLTLRLVDAAKRS